jgi:peptidoglycan/xylan/chitin deacetylase (PgdA/CDA1 family)
MRRRLTPLLGALAALAPAAPAAPAVTVAPTVHVEQAQRTNGPLDLAAVTLMQSQGQLVVTIATRGDWTPGQLKPAGRRRLCLTVARAGTAPRIACVAKAAGGLGLRVAGRVTPVDGARPDGHTVVLRIDPTLLGLAPGRFTWQVTSAWTDAAACPPTAACHDALPAESPAADRLVATPAVGCTRSGTTPVYHGSRSARVVALTFDDGPWPDTPGFVSVLERERVPATFFLIGRQVAGHGALLARELRDGDALGNHTFTHPNLVATGDAQAQLAQTSAVIEQTSGYRPCVFRPPYGAVDAGVVATALGQSLTTVVWDVDPSDYTRPGTDVIVRRVLAGVRSGSIVLMHDGGGPRGETLAALPRIIDALRARGYRFATVPELLGYPTLYA